MISQISFRNSIVYLIPGLLALSIGLAQPRVQAESFEAPSPPTSPDRIFFSTDRNQNLVIEFKDHGRLVKTFTKSQLIESLPVQQKRIYEFLEDGQEKEGSTPENPSAWVNYGLLLADQVLDLAYGESWHKAGLILFTCVDNYKPTVPVARFTNHELTGFFAVYRKDGKENDSSFLIRNRVDGNKIVPLGPLYLTWDQMEKPNVLKEGKIFIPYQIIGLDLVDLDYRKVSIAADSSKAVERGATHFRHYCSRCHQIQGNDGGQRGTDLTLAGERYQGKEGVLAQKIRNPRAAFADSTMTPLSAVIADPSQLDNAINDLIEFLKDLSEKAKNSPAPRSLLR